MKIILSLLFSLLYIQTYAHLYIEGLPVAFDEKSHLWLATIPQDYLGKTCQLNISTDSKWKSTIINGQVIDSTYTFKNITANSMYSVLLNGYHGNSLTGIIMFTFLPIVQLNGNFGQNYSQGSIVLSDPIYNYSDTLKANIKWRGSITGGTDKHKHNYKIIFNKDVSLFGFRVDDKWLLDAGQIDVFRLRNRVATDIWNNMNSRPYYVEYEPNARLGVRGKIVELFLNNQYWGIYNMSENIDRKLTKIKKCEYGEIHGCMWKAVGYGLTKMKWNNYNNIVPYNNYKDKWDYFEAKYPDFEDNDTTDWKPLYDAIYFANFANNSDFSKYANKYFDIPVLIDYFLFINILNALDNCGKNMIWALYDKKIDRRITPIVWDLDFTAGQRWMERASHYQYSPYYPIQYGVYPVERLFTLNAQHFTERSLERYQELRKSLFSTDSLKQYYINYYQMLVESGADKREINRWSGDNDIDGYEIDFDSEIQYICQWIENRMEYLDKSLLQIAKLSVESPYFNISPTSINYYRLNGTKMPGSIVHQKPGIYIVQGRKYLVK